MNGHVFCVQTRISISKLCQTLCTLGIHIISIHNYHIHHAKYVIIPFLSKLYHKSHVSMPQCYIIQVTFCFLFCISFWKKIEILQLGDLMQQNFSHL